jgi:hypothetical protein
MQKRGIAHAAAQNPCQKQYSFLAHFGMFVRVQECRLLAVVMLPLFLGRTPVLVFSSFLSVLHADRVSVL